MYAATPMSIPGKRIGEQSERSGRRLQVAVLDAADHGWGLSAFPDRRLVFVGNAASDRQSPQPWD
jgi:hypothetical protein